MKILIIQERGRHRANEEFREALNLSRALKKIGHEGLVWGLNYETPPFDEMEKKSDAVLLLENYESGSWVPDLSKIRKLKIFWSIDSHCVLNKHLDTCRKNLIDIVLCSTYSHMDRFPWTKNFWFPNCYPDDLIKPNWQAEKKWDVGFCGNIQNRGPWLSRLRKLYGLRTDVMKIGMDMVRAIHSYRIHFNRNIADDLNYRTFETLGCGTLLITNETDQLSDLFEIGNHLVTYDSPEDLHDKIDYYLAHPDIANRIARLGYAHASTHHTYVARAKKLIKIIEENI